MVPQVLPTDGEVDLGELLADKRPTVLYFVRNFGEPSHDRRPTTQLTVDTTTTTLTTTTTTTPTAPHPRCPA